MSQTTTLQDNYSIYNNMDLKTFKMWEMAANSVGGGGVSMPADVLHGKKKKKKKNEIVKREKLKNAKNS